MKLNDILKSKDSITIHCLTNEEASIVCRILNAHGLKWKDGKPYAQDRVIGYMSAYKEGQTCFNPKEGLMESRGYAQWRGHTIIPASEFIAENEHN
ncbi:hypothetical protein VF04_38120 [Nostoc linckia z7]|uniref:Uncharacterized protein n=1 Tax=Nostoc linckia z7 TaxID=1628745 RepID=A0ABX4KAV4_NOSLI|nr:hypothetical protein VF02_37940 [Nostoc linckia z1]PHJ59288.1 hypothetical protein VF05_32360 [Nostoc linckia z3]PHJ63683.1 hypothetical protein VF03_30235 [Nostoc linckia z2]PHJ73855.1 hypothetical protein VF06_35655 [Nostoc linckia z4]PHJ79759.1 hypothetical protein VF04_38120 [Nostoc linckia z7]